MHIFCCSKEIEESSLLTMKTHISVQTIAINVMSLNDAHFFVVRLQWAFNIS